MPAAIAQVEPREEVADHHQHEELGTEAETQQTDDPEQYPGHDLDEPELVGAKLAVSADQVTLQAADSLLGRDPRRSSRGVEPPPQLLPDVSQRSIRGADWTLRTQRPLRVHEPGDE